MGGTSSALANPNTATTPARRAFDHGCRSSPPLVPDPSLIEVLQDPGAHFPPNEQGAAYNAGADYSSGLHSGIYFTGQRIDNFPLSQHD